MFVLHSALSTYRDYSHVPIICAPDLTHVQLVNTCLYRAERRNAINVLETARSYRSVNKLRRKSN